MAEVRMRDAGERERAATPLELLFDLCFVVAVALLAKDLHYGISHGHSVESVLAYGLLFVPVWWAWMSFTWFATAFDNDDAVHRLLAMSQMIGVVGLAATVHPAADGELAAFGWALLVLRVPLVVQWLRASRADRDNRPFAQAYAGGLAAGAVLWWCGTRIEVPEAFVVLLPALIVDLATPMLAVRRAPGPVFNPGHIAERYGLFTLIVIGESILAMTVAVESVVEGKVDTAGLAGVICGGAAVAFGTWWIYFSALGRDGLTRNRRAAFTWGYGHYLLFAATAAAGAGVQVQVDLLSGKASVGTAGALAAVAIPAAVVLFAIAGLQVAANRRMGEAPPLLGGGLLLACIPLVGDLRFGGLIVAAVVASVAVVVSGKGGASR